MIEGTLDITISNQTVPPLGDYASVLSLSYDNAVAEKVYALKSYYRSVRLIKNSNLLNVSTPTQPSYITNILLCGNCIDPETRCLYVFYVDTLLAAAWIIEINIDTRSQKVVYYDRYNVINFNALHKIYNARVVHGRIIWTDNLNPIYQIDVERAKRSFYYGIGYGQYPITEEWSSVKSGGYALGQIVSRGNYFYKSVIADNVGNDPWLEDVTLWTRLCQIEDAYYSMNIENFYFEAMPPKHPPVVTYKSDDSRKINNLRQTLFQIAYRYVYMDWRKSTYSPASIVPVPQAEEEAATGLANEQISLNNQLDIQFNTGGEEVRAIEIVGRSSQDISKWFLIDTIEKFTTQEKGSEISTVVNAPYVGLGLSAKAPLVISLSTQEPDIDVDMGLSVRTPYAVNSWIASSIEAMVWEATSFGLAAETLAVITAKPLSCQITYIPGWITVWDNIGGPIAAGSFINDGDTIRVFPSGQNTGGNLSSYITLVNMYGDSLNIIMFQMGVTPPSPQQILVSPSDTTGMTVPLGAAYCTNGSLVAALMFFADHPLYANDEEFTMFWSATKNGIFDGRGNFNAINRNTTSVSINLSSIFASTDVVIVYLSSIEI